MLVLISWCVFRLACFFHLLYLCVVGLWISCEATSGRETNINYWNLLIVSSSKMFNQKNLEKFLLIYLNLFEKFICKQDSFECLNTQTQQKHWRCPVYTCVKCSWSIHHHHHHQSMDTAERITAALTINGKKGEKCQIQPNEMWASQREVLHRFVSREQMEMMRVKDCDKKNVAHIKLRTPTNLFGNIPKVYTWRSMRATRWFLASRNYL